MIQRSVEGGRVVATGEARCRRIAEGQHGVLSRAQVLSSGLTDDQLNYRLKTGKWRRVHPSVYRIDGAPDSFRQQLCAVALWAEFELAFSHRTAAALWRFARYPEGAIDITLCRHAPLKPPIRVYRVAELDPSHVCTRDAFPVTTVARTLVDLAATEVLADVRASLDQALRRDLTSIESLRKIVAAGDWLHGARTLRNLLGELHREGGPTESELEAMVRDILKDAGLTPTRQHRVRVKGRLRRLDFVFEREKIVIEADGYETHSTWDAFQDDRRRNNALTAQGFRVLHWTWAQVRDCPHELVAELRAVLALVRGRGA